MLQKAYLCPSNYGIPFLYELVLSMVIESRSDRGRDLSDAEDRGMVPWGEDLSDAKDRGKFIRYRGQRHGSRGSMSDMISVLHQSVAINAKGGDS
jgi:hypothetical protein